MTNTTVGREPLQIVEIIQPRCSNTYGIAPCTATGAAGSECFNTRKTCQDAANYNAANTLTWRFSTVDAKRPLDIYSSSAGDFASNPFPMLVNAQTSPTEVNLGGTGDNSTAFGVRASLTCTFQDAPSNDKFADPYIANRSYIATDRGTFWSKWLARNPYYNQYVVKVYDGYHGQTLGQMQVREYLIDTISNPDSNGTVKLTAKDPMRLADRSRTLFPPVSSITLKNAITDIETGFAVLGTNAELTQVMYESTYLAIIGDEMISYTGVTEVIADEEYTLNGVVRGIAGTVAEAADAGDAVQRVGQWSSQRLDDILEDLLFDTLGARIDTAYYTPADWATELDNYASEFQSVSAYVVEPTPVAELVSELADQCGFVIWWDDRDAKIKLQFIRPPEVTPTLITEELNIISGSFNIADDHKRRLSRVTISYNPFTPVTLDKQSDFANTYIGVNASFESADLYNEVRNKKLLSRWLTTAAQASTTVTRHLNLLSVTPKIATFRLDAKDRSVWTGSIIDIEHSSIVDETGQKATERFFVISANEIQSGEVIQYKAISYAFSGRFGRWMVSDAPVFLSATATQRESGMWWSDAAGLMGDGSEGYKWQ